MQSIVLSKGGMLGLTSILLSLVIYFVAPDLLAQWYMALISMVIFLYFMTSAARTFKAANEGVMSFGQGLLSAWFTGLVGGLIGMLFTYVLFNFIDPSLKEQATEAAIKMIEAFAGSMPEEEYDKAIEKIENTDSFGLQAQLTNFIFMSVLGLIPSLIIAAITKNDSNEFA